MALRDTHAAAHQLQHALYHQMTPETKGEYAALLSDDIRQIARVGIRLRHPEYTDSEVSRALITLLFGKDVARSIWPEA